jgi:murein DD-endopeptidase MepM/ murein hydrolase activator NlpD
MTKKLTLALTAIICTALILAQTLISTPQQISAVSQSDLNNAQNKTNNLKAELGGVSKDLSDAIIEVDSLEKEKIPAANAAIASANKTLEETTAIAAALDRQLTAAKRDKSQIEDAIATNDKNENNARENVAMLAREKMIMQTNEYSYLDVVNNTDDLDSFIQNLETAETLSRNQSRILDTSAILSSAALTKSEKIDAINELVTKLEADAAVNKQKAETAKVAADTNKANLETMKTNLAAKKVYLASKQNDLNAQIKKAAADEARMQAELSAQGGGNSGTAYPAPPNGGGFVWPSDTHYITSPFGPRNTGIPGASTFHNGVDIGSSCGTPIWATRAGTVTIASFKYSTSGNMVSIDHGSIAGNNYVSMYMHMISTPPVRVGQHVEAGQLIGYTGSTGASSGCHIHFQINVNGSPQNPMKYF